MVNVLFNPFDDAVFNMNDFVGLVGYSAFVGNDYNSKFFFFVQVFEQLNYFYRCLAIQRSGWFVGQNDLWFGDKCAGNGHTLLLSSR